MFRKFALIVSIFLFSSTAFAACELKDMADQKNYAHCLELAEKGDAQAQFILASMIYDGKADYDKSIQWFLKSAEQGHKLAQVSLGMDYARGVGIPKDRVTALMWMNIVDADGLESMVLFRTVLMSQMNADQIEQSKFLSEVWLEKH